MESINIHIHPSSFTGKHESRILRITDSLARHVVFDKVYIAALWEEGLQEIEDIDKTRRALRLRTKLRKTRKGTLWKTLTFLEWYIRILYRFRQVKVSCVNPHTISTLPMAICFKLIKTCKVVYDTHELETETIEATGFRKKIGKIVEKRLIPFVDAVLVTSDGYGAWYKREYSLRNVWVIKNFPYQGKQATNKQRILKEHCGVGEGETLFIYQGLMSRGRGIDIILNVFANAAPDKHIVFMGFGEFVDMIKDYERKYRNIHFYPGVKSSDVAQYTGSADVSISLIENVCLSYFHTLPNKVLESLNAGVPVIVSDFPDMGALVDKYNCGWRVQVNEYHLAGLIAGISSEEIAAKRIRALKWAEEHTWEREEKTLLKIYRQLIS